MAKPKNKTVNKFKQMGLKGRLLLFVGCFALVGSILLLISRASSNNQSLESSQFSLLNGAMSKDDDTAGSSGGSYIKFGNARIVAAGDIMNSDQTANLIDTLNPDGVLTIGDNAYPCGTRLDYETHFNKVVDGVKTGWGRPSIMNKIYPIPGNHEYIQPGATRCIDSESGTQRTNTDKAKDYRIFFKERLKQLLGVTTDDEIRSNKRTWYSFDVDKWKIYALDSQCADLPFTPTAAGSPTDGCDVGSEQYNWLDAQLRANAESDARKCTMAFWHIPTSGIKDGFYVEAPPTSPAPATTGTTSSGLSSAADTSPIDVGEIEEDARETRAGLATGASSGTTSKRGQLWKRLYDAGTDVVLTAHGHSYQRFKPLTGNPNVAATGTGFGTTKFMVGTGGAGVPYLLTDGNYGDIIDYTSDDFYEKDYPGAANETNRNLLCTIASNLTPHRSYIKKSRITRCGNLFRRTGVLELVLNDNSLEYRFVSIIKKNKSVTVGGQNFTINDTTPRVMDEGTIQCKLKT